MGKSTFSDWTLSRLAAVKDRSFVLVRDHQRLLQPSDGAIHAFARDNKLTVVVASTNLAFRDLFERTMADPETKRLLVVDRSRPTTNRENMAPKAPSAFYPDLLARLSDDAIINIDLRQFLIETTGDVNWPAETNDPRFAKLIASHLEETLRAYQNLRATDATRFNDNDFETMVAFASLGMGESAFKKLNERDCWMIGLTRHQEVEQLKSLAPDVAKQVLGALEKAPVPFRYLLSHDPALVVRAYYLSALLAQHFEDWEQLVVSLAPELASLVKGISAQTLRDTALALTGLDRDSARNDLEGVENSLSADALRIVLDKMKVAVPNGFAAVLEREHLSTLFRSLALLAALDNLLMEGEASAEQARVQAVLSPDKEPKGAAFVESRASAAWDDLKRAYLLARDVRTLRTELNNAVRTLKVDKAAQSSFQFFSNLWNVKRVNRIEYYMSALDRLVRGASLLPRGEQDLPAEFVGVLNRVQQRVGVIAEEVQKNLENVNLRFQALVASKYSTWSKGQDDIFLTAQFVARVLKPNWDPVKEKAALLVFDGMRYDIWDEMLRPMLEERMQVVSEAQGMSLLPSETHISRKAIFAGAFPDKFDTGAAENKLLKETLSRELRLSLDVDVKPHQGTGAGETVRYQAGNLDVYVFELCDKELHKLDVKSLADGRRVPSRPLSFIYEQHIRNILENEVAGIVRNLSAGTKVFVVADHGFGPIGRQAIHVEAAWLNEPEDCNYSNARLKVLLKDSGAPTNVTGFVWEAPVANLKMPSNENVFDRKTKQTKQKDYASVLFPHPGYALARPGFGFRPDAFSHGGISLQELIIPMVVLRVMPKDQGSLFLDGILGPTEILEGQEAAFSMRVSRVLSGKMQSDEMRVDIDATYRVDQEEQRLSHQVLYVSAGGAEMVFKFKPDSQMVTTEQQKRGHAEIILTVVANYKENGQPKSKYRDLRFVLRLNPDRVVRRVPPHLGNILGLTPKNMR